MTNQTSALTKLIASTWKITFSKIRHIYKAMIRSDIIYKSIAWYEFKNIKLISKKMINDLTIIQNNCLRRIFDVYKTTFIAKLKTKTHISFINIHLNELQAKIKQRFQCSKHYEKIEKIKRKIHKTLKKNRQKKAKFISKLQKKVWLKNFNENIKEHETANTQRNQKKNQNSRKKLTNYFVKFWKNRWKDHQTKSFRNLISARTKDSDKKIIQLHQNFVKAKNALTTQIRIENVKLAIFLYNRRISKINSSTCLCDHQK